MTREATFQWRDVYFNFIKGFDDTLTDPNLKTIRLKRDYGELVISETKGIDLRETGGKREYVKAIFKSAHGYVVMTTLEGHNTGSIYYLK